MIPFFIIQDTQCFLITVIDVIDDIEIFCHIIQIPSYQSLYLQLNQRLRTVVFFFFKGNLRFFSHLLQFVHDFISYHEFLFIYLRLLVCLS